MEPASPEYSMDDFEEPPDEFAQTTSTFFGADSDDEEVATLHGTAGLGRKSSEASVCTGTTTTPSSEEVGYVVEKQMPRQEPLTDEGRELNEALREAQLALDVARQYVNSPSLAERTPALVRPASAASGYKENSVSHVDAKSSGEEAPVCLDSSQAEEPSKPLGQKRSRLPPVGARPEAPACAASAGYNQEGYLPGEAAARARVRRARSMEVAKRLREEAQAAAKEAERASLSSAMEAHRRRAAQRAASEQRALRSAQRQEEELQRLQERRSLEQRALGLRYAKSASRRVESERCRRQELAREVLLNLHAEQTARREAAQQKGGELAQKCKDSDFSHCQPVVESRWRKKRRAYSEPPERESSLRLPPIA